MAYVYVYFDPRSIPPTPIYVGKGTGRRIRYHWDKKCDNNCFRGKLNSLRTLGLAPIIVKVFDGLTHSEASLIEAQLIQAYGRIASGTGTLCNFTDGYDGTWGYTHREETKQLFSQQRKGKKQTQAQYKANCSRVHTEESCRKRSLANKGHRRHSAYQMEILKKNQSRAKRFKVIHPNGQEEEILNLRRFCKSKGLDRTSATKAATAQIQYKGYTFIRIESKPDNPQSS